MIKKLLTLVVFLYVLILVQTSFLAHFNVFQFLSNFVLIFAVGLNFFGLSFFWGSRSARPEWQKTCREFGPAFVGGLFWDIFSDCFLGFHVLALLALVIFMNFVFKNYIRLPIFHG